MNSNENKKKRKRLNVKTRKMIADFMRERECARMGCCLRSFGIEKVVVSMLEVQQDVPGYLFKYQCINCGRIFYFPEEPDIYKPYFPYLQENVMKEFS